MGLLSGDWGWVWGERPFLGQIIFDSTIAQQFAWTLKILRLINTADTTIPFLSFLDLLFLGLAVGSGTRFFPDTIAPTVTCPASWCSPCTKPSGFYNVSCASWLHSEGAKHTLQGGFKHGIYFCDQTQKSPIHGIKHKQISAFEFQLGDFFTSKNKQNLNQADLP